MLDSRLLDGNAEEGICRIRRAHHSFLETSIFGVFVGDKGLTTRATHDIRQDKLQRKAPRTCINEKTDWAGCSFILGGLCHIFLSFLRDVLPSSGELEEVGFRVDSCDDEGRQKLGGRNGPAWGCQEAVWYGRLTALPLRNRVVLRREGIKIKTQKQRKKKKTCNQSGVKICRFLAAALATRPRRDGGPIPGTDRIR